MDTLHSVLFYALATVTVGGALATALGPARLRLFAMAAVAIGLGGLYADLSAAFAGLVALLAFIAVALLANARRDSEAGVQEAPRSIFQQLGGPLSALVFAVLAYLAWRTDFHAGFHPSGEINATALGRLLVNRDALALEALAAAFLLAVIGARSRLRSRRP